MQAIEKNTITKERRKTMLRTLKTSMQAFLRGAGLYHRIRYSFLYDFYWGINNRKLIENRSEEVKFYQKTLEGLKKGDLVFDIGANVGYKTDIFLRLGTQVVAVEPDRLNQETLRRNFLSYRLVRKPVRIVGKAVSDKIGSDVMWVDQPGSAINSLNQKWVESLRTDDSRFGTISEFDNKVEVETTTVEDLIRSYGRPFYIKIDVEGHEASVLKGMQSIVPFVSFEVNLPQFRPEALQCIESLENLAPGGHFNYASDCARGLIFEPWLPRATFIDAFNQCAESSIEVFWKAPAHSGGGAK
jgi:FkbM family methyltransferase